VIDPVHIPESAPDAVIRLERIHKIYKMGEVEVHALHGASLMVHRGEFVAIMGPSGSGKSTMMNIIGCLDRPTKGQYLLDGQDVSKLNKAQLADIRNQRVGFVFQSFNLVPRTSAIENVELPLLYAGVGSAERLRRAREALAIVGLADRGKNMPNQLSGGQQQRVAIARALAMQPRLLLLDEVTSALDPELVAEVLDVIRELADGGMTMLIATHEMGFARDVAHRVCFLDAGRILEEGRPDQLFGAPREERTRQFLQRIVAAGRL